MTNEIQPEHGDPIATDHRKKMCDNAELESLRKWRKEAREIVVHEDNLINSRITRLSAAQAVLGTGYFLGPSEIRALPIIPALGIFFSLLTFWGVWSAGTAILKIGSEWIEKKNRLTGKGLDLSYIVRPIGLRYDNTLMQFLQPHTIFPLAFGILWLIPIFFAEEVANVIEDAETSISSVAADVVENKNEGEPE